MAPLYLLRFRLSLIRVVLADLATRVVRGARFVVTAKPVAGGSPEADDADEGDDGKDDADDSKDDKPAKPAAKSGKDADDDSDDDDDDKPAAATEPDWKRQSRKWEREAKKARKEREELEQRLQATDAEKMSEHEKAIEAARKEERQAADKEHEQTRRTDKLEVAVTRLATKGVKVGDGDEQKTLKFADPDDALLNLERAIRRGDIDGDDIFGTDGKVNSDELTSALSELLEQKPHLAVRSDGGSGSGAPSKVKGSADGGKGAPAKTDTSVDDHFKAIRRNKAA